MPGKRLISAVLLLALSLALATAQEANGVKPGPAPPLPYYDWKACPFEGCVYREWTALKTIAVYDTMEDHRRNIARLEAGSKVKAITGVVITFKPGTIHMDKDLPEDGLKRGDTILTYTYRGEGFSAVWFGGKFYPEFDISFTKWPDGAGCGGEHCAATYVDLGKKVWWAKVRLPSGNIGWVNMNESEFDGTDELAFFTIETLSHLDRTENP
ncbi:MAG: hypothetical protein ACR2IF_02500 [Terriglobales bacterium]